MRACILGLCLLGLAAHAAQPELVNGLAAIVNKAVITFEEVENSIGDEVLLLERQYARQPQVFRQKLNELRRDRLEMMIDRQLILHEYQLKGYNLPDTFFERAIRERIREQFGDRVKLTKTLQAQGRTYESWARRLREQMIVDVMTREFVSPDKIIVSPNKIEKHYQENLEQFRLEDQIHMRMMFLPQGANAPAGLARKLAEEILVKLKEGATFAEMATVYSGDSNRAQGGDRGWERRSALREDLAEMAFSLPPGETSPVLEKPEGCYLMLVEAVKPAHVQPLPEVKEEIERRLKSDEFNRLRSKWLNRLRSNSFVRQF
jgi:peptidyl-prolyl cis-trans isomerase SurA